MFLVNNEFKNTNVSRTIRFTDSLFDRLNQVAGENNISFNLLYCSAANTPWTTWKNRKKTSLLQNKPQKACFFIAKPEEAFTRPGEPMEK